MLEKQKYYLETVKTMLERQKITVNTMNVDMFDLLQVVRTVASLVFQEKSSGNTVFVNVSGAGRLTSIGATLAAMAHGAKAYYVGADGYSESEEDKMKHGLSICTKLDIQFLEPFEFRLPKKNGIRVLVKLCENPDKGMKTIDLIEHLAKEKVEGFTEYANIRSPKFPRALKQRGSMKLNKGVLTELEQSRYIIREYIGKYNTIKITNAGAYVASISGLMKI